MTQPWTWRKGLGGFIPPSSTPGKPFHAYDVNDNAACIDGYGLAASCEPPNEGSSLCAECVAAVKSLPAGRDKRV
jgi:hypothetical protein